MPADPAPTHRRVGRSERPACWSVGSRWRRARTNTARGARRWLRARAARRGRLPDLSTCGPLPYRPGKAETEAVRRDCPAGRQISTTPFGGSAGTEQLGVSESLPPSVALQGISRTPESLLPADRLGPEQ